MKPGRLWIAMALGLGFTTALIAGLGARSRPALASPAVWYVTANCAASPDPVHCRASIQAAVDQATAGDTIKIAEGTYSQVGARQGITQVVHIEKSLSLLGGFTDLDWATPRPATHPSVIDAQQLGRGVVITGPVTTTLEGLHVIHGNADGLLGGLSGQDAGGGVYVHQASVSIRHCRIEDNVAHASFDSPAYQGYGGGLYLRFSQHSTLQHNVIRHNDASHVAHGSGGGLTAFNSHNLTLANNLIELNRGTTGGNGVGGGVYLSDCDHARLSHNTILSNTTSEGADAWAGGLYLHGCQQLHLAHNLIKGNVAAAYTWGYAGGLYLGNSVGARLEGNVIVNNVATNGAAASGWGGGVYLATVYGTMTNTVIADNHARAEGSGLYVDNGNVHLLHTTLARNAGGDGTALHLADTAPGTIAMTNTIVTNQAIGIFAGTGSTARLHATLWYLNGSNSSGGGTINATANRGGNPAYGQDGYHLTAASAAINQGVDAGVTRDLDGDRRPQRGAYDLGADEYARHVFLPLTSR